MTEEIKEIEKGNEIERGRRAGTVSSRLVDERVKRRKMEKKKIKHGSKTDKKRGTDRTTVNAG